MKVTANIRTREDISNPWRHIPHAELLKLAGVEVRDPKDAIIIPLGNGYIRVEWKDNVGNIQRK